MNLKELKEKIQELEKQGVIDNNTKLVALGEYAYGTSIDNVYASELAHVDGEVVVSEPKTVLAFYVDSYLHEHEDLGWCDMWIDTNDFKEFKENCDG